MHTVRDVSQPKERSKRQHFGALAMFIFQFLGLFAFWLVLSGRYEAKYVVMGILAVGLVTFLNRDILRLDGDRGADVASELRYVAATFWRFIVYLPWLLLSIVQANLQVAYLVLHPRMPINPALLQFRTGYRSRFTEVTLANSITLTPGTITVDLRDGTYVIHAIAPASAESLLTAEMQNRVGAVFGEQVEQTPEVLWTPAVQEPKQ